MKKTILITLHIVLKMLLLVPSFAGELGEIREKLSVLEEKVKTLEGHANEAPQHKHLGISEHEFDHTSYGGFTFSGQMTAIYQTSSLNLHEGDLANPGTNNKLSNIELDDFRHKNGSGTFSADFIIEKKIGDNGYAQIDLQFANGGGIDGPLQGGAMVNNDVMEDPEHHNQPYLAKAFYEHELNITENYKVIADVGKFGVNDFFDINDEVSDQTTQFLNQAICNNGAFDYVQDLSGHGYTYGARLAFETPWVLFDTAFFSSDSHLDNINKKYSVLAGVTFTPKFTEKIKGEYNFYFFKNFGEYGRFDNNGNFFSKDPNAGTEDSAINTANNPDDLDKKGFGISIDQDISFGIDLFAKYGKQDDDRDVRHYQDMDESYMFGANISGENWSRKYDILGIAYEIGKLTGNHRKAHKKGYNSFFSRSGTKSYDDERVLEIYYKFAINENMNISVDYQHIENFNYSSRIGNVSFWAGRFNVSF